MAIQQYDSRVARPSQADVDHVRNDLLSRIPCELVDIILEGAQYWARISTKRDTFISIRTSNERLHNAKWIYMLSNPIPTLYNGKDVVSTRVKSVRFSIKSCDQGWGGFSECKNTYRNSYTWFEASILRPTYPSQPPPRWMNEALHKPVNIGNLTEYGWTELYSPYSKRNRRWMVQMNAQASRHVRHHDITWSPTLSTGGVNSDSVTSEVEYDEKTGSGRGLGFVESLQAGDRIALFARALYPGWENNVCSAEIEIAYQA